MYLLNWLSSNFMIVLFIFFCFIFFYLFLYIFFFNFYLFFLFMYNFFVNVIFHCMLLFHLLPSHSIIFLHNSSSVSTFLCTPSRVHMYIVFIGCINIVYLLHLKFFLTLLLNICAFCFAVFICI